MEEQKTSAEASVIRAIWVVFGYSFVGFISLFYGISLQYFNQGGNFIKLFTDSSFKSAYIIIIVSTIVYNLLFCHAYASLYVKETDIDKILYPRLGHWLETILLIIMMVYFVFVLVSSSNWKNILLIMVSISIIWCTAIIFYRTFLPYCKRKKYIRPRRTKHRLIIPSFMLVAVNIYIGGSIFEMWQGQIAYFIPFWVFSIFIISYCLIEFIDYRIKKQGDEINPWDYYLPYGYYALLLVFAFICLFQHHYQNNDLFYIPMRTLFSASFVAVYLSMFEGWFLIRTKDDNPLKEKVELILHYMPIVVFVLFPFQRFQIIFYVGFILGHLFTWLYWVLHESKLEMNVHRTSIMRGILGTLTLVILIFDKLLDWDVTRTIGIIIHVKNLTEFNKFMPVISMFISLYALGKDYVDTKKIKMAFMDNRRVIIYFFIMLVNSFFYSSIKDIEQARIFLSMMGCAIFAVFELVVKYKINNQGNEVNYEEKTP